MHKIEDFPEDPEELIKSSVLLHSNDRSGGVLLKFRESIAIKMFPSKGSFFSFARSVFNKTKAHRQFWSANILQSIGLNTPAPVSVKVFRWASFYEAAYLYRYKENVKLLREVLEDSTDEGLLDCLAAELSIMAENDLLFVDFHFSNVLVDENGNLWWIDPELKKSRSLLKKRFWSRMERVRVKTDPGVLDESGWTYFESQLRKRLPEWLR